VTDEVTLGHTFSISEAAAACGVSRDTVKRRVKAGAFPHATKDEAGAWSIPLADLLAADLHPHAATAADVAEVVDAAREQHVVFARADQLELEVAVLRARLEAAEHARETAERARDSAERARGELLDALMAALAKLPPALAPGGENVTQGPAPPAAPGGAPAAPAARRRWWQRRTP
jgi:hypothetical protein